MSKVSEVIHISSFRNFSIAALKMIPLQKKLHGVVPILRSQKSLS